MSRHDGVSCDSCLKGNFRGRRYKCLICYDYDLCSACYEAGATNSRHTTDHPMQCILTRADFELYYGGEALTNLELPQSYTCPYCCRMGFTDATLQEHVSAEHSENSYEVVCPLCAAMPGGDPNLMTDDFAGHLTLEHRTGPRDLISFLEEPVVGSRHNLRRMQHSTHSGSHIGRGSASLRPRRSNMHFRRSSSLLSNSLSFIAPESPCMESSASPSQIIVFSSGGLSSLSPSSRESVDPIAELLSQLSGVRRSAGNSNTSTPSQLQQLQMQLQLERQHVNAARQQIERFPRRPTQSQPASREPAASSSSGSCTLMLNPSPVLVQPSSGTPSVPSPSSQFLLTGLLEELSLQSATDQTRQDRSQFVQELVLSSICGNQNDDNATPSKPPSRQSTTVPRGRARSDAQNALRRAQANKNANIENIAENNQR